MKRAFDITASVVALIALSPVMVVVAIVIRLTLGRPVLFRQLRPGLQGRPFEILKFRTMRSEVDVHGRTSDDADRLTPLGGLLRAASLDELPELLNVLRGDMSLVGPRPLLIDYLPLYTPEQARRHEVRPGITGWAQINGRNSVGWIERLAMDVWYVDNHSLLLDVKILLLTVIKVLKREGISHDNHVTMERFCGSTSESTPIKEHEEA